MSVFQGFNVNTIAGQGGFLRPKNRLQNFTKFAYKIVYDAQGRLEPGGETLKRRNKKQEEKRKLNKKNWFKYPPLDKTPPPPIYVKVC